MNSTRGFGHGDVAPDWMHAQHCLSPRNASRTRRSQGIASRIRELGGRATGRDAMAPITRCALIPASYLHEQLQAETPTALGLQASLCI